MAVLSLIAGSEHYDVLETQYLADTVLKYRVLMSTSPAVRARVCQIATIIERLMRRMYPRHPLAYLQTIELDW